MERVQLRVTGAYIRWTAGFLFRSLRGFRSRGVLYKNLIFFRGLKGEADTKTNTKTKTKTYVSVRWPDDESLHCVCLLLLFFFASVHALRLFPPPLSGAV